MAKTDLSDFDYTEVAQYDSDMWRAYYNHKFFRLFRQLFKLMKSQLGLNWFFTLQLAYYAGWAAADYRINKKRGVNNRRVVKNLTNFYRIISNRSVRPFDFREAAELELKWWDIHRKSTKNNPELEQSLANAVAVVYHIKPSDAKAYAHYRAEAMILPRHEGDEQPVPTDWEKVTELLVKSWKALHDAIRASAKR